jgi:hypothetical protein
MFRKFSLAALALTTSLAAGACTDQPLTSLDELSVSPNFNTGGLTERVTGSGHFDDVRFPDAEFRSFSFTALAKADGSVTGQWELNNRNFPVRIHGVVECVSVNGNEAWFAGTTTQSDDEAQVGVIRAYRVVDNGEGSGAIADEVSFSPAVGNAQAWCDAQSALVTNPIEEGNVQVR